MNRDEALTRAGELINGDRARDYGDASVNFGRIASLLSAQFAHKLTEDFTAADVAIALTHLKLSRLAVTPAHADSWVDAAGYVALGAELATGDTGTPEPETSPAKPGSSASQDGLRVGARVRVTASDSYDGLEGVIVAETYEDEWFMVKLGKQAPLEFSADELEVIQ